MAGVRKVALLGNSLVTSSLASTLRGRPEFDVIQLDASGDGALIGLRDAHPGAVICELTTRPLDLIFRLLGEYPGLLVIGIDVEGDRMVVLSGRQASLRTEHDLLEALRLPAGRDERPGDGVGTESRSGYLVEGKE